MASAPSSQPSTSARGRAASRPIHTEAHDRRSTYRTHTKVATSNATTPTTLSDVPGTPAATDRWTNSGVSSAAATPHAANATTRNVVMRHGARSAPLGAKRNFERLNASGRTPASASRQPR